MATLDRLLRSAPRRLSPYYKPFTQRPYRGAYPLGSARRGISYTSSSLSPGLLLIQKNPYAASPKSQLSLYEDRRRYHPLGRYRPAVSLAESYPQIVERKPWRDPGPHYPMVDPRGVPQKLVPSKTDPSGWTYIADSPSVLEKWKVGWENPWKVAICLKRAMRKEVMHALGMAGKPSYKKPVFTQYSKVRCF